MLEKFGVVICGVPSAPRDSPAAPPAAAAAKIPRYIQRVLDKSAEAAEAATPPPRKKSKPAPAKPAPAKPAPVRRVASPIPASPIPASPFPASPLVAAAVAGAGSPAVSETGSTMSSAEFMDDTAASVKSDADDAEYQGYLPASQIPAGPAQLRVRLPKPYVQPGTRTLHGPELSCSSSDEEPFSTRAS
jgi:hypothetical protein